MSKSGESEQMRDTAEAEAPWLLTLATQATYSILYTAPWLAEMGTYPKSPSKVRALST